MAREKTTDFEAFEHINELFGGNIRAATDIEAVDVIPTSSFSLDKALGVGGWPRGRIIQLAGKPSAGKTALSLLAIAEWQRMDPENCAAFLDAEYTYDPAWAAKLGVDNKRVMVVKDNSGVHIFTGLVGKVKVNATTKKQTKVPGLLDYIREGKKIPIKNSLTGEINIINCAKLGVIVLDSVASVNTPTEEAADVGKAQMAIMGRFLSTELKKLIPAVAHANVAFLAINQVRTDLGKMFGDPTSTSGGNAWKHACSVMVMVAPSFSKDKMIFNKHGDQIGGRVLAKIAKNKVGTPFKVAEYDLRFDKGVVNIEEEILATGLLTGFVERPTVQSYTIYGNKMKKADAIQFIKDNFEKVVEDLKASLLNDVELDGSEEEEEVGENPFADIEDFVGDLSEDASE